MIIRWSTLSHRPIYSVKVVIVDLILDTLAECTRQPFYMPNVFRQFGRMMIWRTVNRLIRHNVSYWFYFNWYTLVWYRSRMLCRPYPPLHYRENTCYIGKWLVLCCRGVVGSVVRYLWGSLDSRYHFETISCSPISREISSNKIFGIILLRENFPCWQLVHPKLRNYLRGLPVFGGEDFR